MEIYIYGAVLLIYPVLVFVSRRGAESGVLERMAGFIARAGYRVRRRIQLPGIMGENTIRSDLAILYPSGRLKGQEEQFAISRVKLVLLIILAGDVLAIASYVASGQQILLTDGYYLRREAVGEEDAEAELELYVTEDTEGGTEKRAAGTEDGGAEESAAGTEDGRAEESAAGTEIRGAEESAAGPKAQEKERQGLYKVPVNAQRLGSREVDTLADSLLKELPELILGDNRDLRHVERDLILPVQVEGYPFRINWESSSYALVDADGTVTNVQVTEEEHGEQPGAGSGKPGQEVLLTPVLTYENGAAGERRYEGGITVTVVPRTITGEERFAQEIRRSIEEADEESVSAGWLPLPEKLEGKSLVWSEKPKDAGTAIILMTALVSAITYLALGSRLHERVRRRGRQMALDYPAIISKFVLYLGAGLSVRNVFYKLGEDYLEQRDEGKEERGAYEEIVLVTRELQAGIPEQEAYAHFRQRCRSAQYTRLCTLLLQNLRMGNRELIAVLQEEARASFEERRSAARELGEEAETKLLLPMILMLAITMVIIIIPAYYSFSM